MADTGDGAAAGRAGAARDLAVALLLVAAFGALRLYRLDQAGLSMDESFTWLFAQQDWDRIRAFVVENDMHPPLYFMLTRVFTQIWEGELGVRFLPWLLGTLGLGPLYLAGRLAGGRATGFLALILAGLSVNLIEFSQFGRSYAPMAFCVSCGLVPLAWMAGRPAAAARPVWTSPASAAMYLLAAVATALLPWLHNIGAVYFGAMGIAALLVWAATPGRPGTMLANVLLAGLLAALLFAPYLPDLIRQNRGVAGGFWAPDLDPVALVRALLAMFGAGVWPGRFELAGWVAGALLVAFGLAGLVRLARDGRWPQVVLVATVPAVALAVIVGYSLAVQSIFIGRLFAPALPPWILLLALSVAGFRHGAAGRVAAAAAVAIVATGPVVLLRTPSEPIDWRAVYHTIRTRSAGTPTILVLPNSAAVLAGYHAARLSAGVTLVPAEGPYPAIYPGAVYPTGWRGVPALGDRGLAAFDAAIAAAPGDVWLFLRSHWPYDPENRLKARLDLAYCYQILKIPAEPYTYFVRLVPLGQAAAEPCDRLPGDESFPYMARRDGDIPLERP